MKRFVTSMAMMTLAALAGCTQGTPGGPGTTDANAEKPAYGQADDTFNLSAARMATSLQQGEQTETTVGIKRAKSFDQDVTLKFADLPQGVTVKPARPVIKRGDTDAKITFEAVDEAPVGDFVVKVTGHPTKGGDAQIELKLSVTAKDSFTLSAPRLSTSVNQGESQTVEIGIKRDKKFDQDVALKFSDMPTGVTFEPAAPVIKRGDDHTQITLTATDDAALGDFGIALTGHPAQGADATTNLKLTVVSTEKSIDTDKP
jgi:uncharacterized membrane protein